MTLKTLNSCFVFSKPRHALPPSGSLRPEGHPEDLHIHHPGDHQRLAHPRGDRAGIQVLVGHYLVSRTCQDRMKKDRHSPVKEDTQVFSISTHGTGTPPGQGSIHLLQVYHPLSKIYSLFPCLLSDKRCCPFPQFQEMSLLRLPIPTLGYIIMAPTMAKSYPYP